MKFASYKSFTQLPAGSRRTDSSCVFPRDSHYVSWRQPEHLLPLSPVPFKALLPSGQSRFLGVNESSPEKDIGLIVVPWYGRHHHQRKCTATFIRSFRPLWLPFSVAGQACRVPCGSWSAGCARMRACECVISSRIRAAHAPQLDSGCEFRFSPCRNSPPHIRRCLIM